MTARSRNRSGLMPRTLVAVILSGVCEAKDLGEAMDFSTVERS
jgi:hypothetical protein